MRFRAADDLLGAGLCVAAAVLWTCATAPRDPAGLAASPPADVLAQAPESHSAGSSGTLAMDRIELAGQATCEGLIESEDGDNVNIIRIFRQPGKPMHLVIQPIDRHDIVSIDRIDEAQRALLRQEIDQFRNRASIEAMRMEAVKLQPRTVDGVRFLHYRGNWFQLDSTANESITRLIVVRAEQIFAAYRQIIAPRSHPPAPPRLIVFATFSGYQAYLASLGVKIDNQGCYLEDKNIVVIGSELTRASEILSTALKRNAACRKQLDMLTKLREERLHRVAEQLKQQGLSKAEVEHAVLIERAKFDNQLRAVLAALRKSDLDVARLFKLHMGQTFVRLYHESFHAYLRNYLYPSDKYDVPRWLNEGLAVIFQGGVLEGNTLRVDAPNPEFLKLVKSELNAGRALPLSKLLESKESDFLATEATLPADINRHYAYAWAVAYNLVFDQKLFDSPALEGYMRRSPQAQSATQRFERLTGEPLERFEEAWKQDVLGM